MTPFALLLLATLGSFFNYAPLLSVAPLWAAHGGGAASGAGAATGVTMAATVAAQLAMPALINRVRLNRLLAAGALLLALPTFGYLLSDRLGAVLAVCAARGLGFGIVSVAGSALTGVLVPEERRGRAVGLYGVAVGLPQVVGLPLGVWTAEHVGFAAVFLGTALLSLTAVPLSAAIRVPSSAGPSPRPRASRPARPSRRPAPARASAPSPDGLSGAASSGDPSSGAASSGDASSSDWREGPRTGGGRAAAGSGRRALVRPAALMTAAGAAMGVITTFLPLAPRTGAGTASTSLLLLSAGIVAGRWIGGQFSDRRGPGRLQLPATALAALGTAGLTAAVATGSVPAALAAATAYGLGFGVLQNDTLTVMFRSTGTGKAGTVWNVSYDGGTGLGAVATGGISHLLGLTASFGVSAVLVGATAAAAAVRVPRPFRRRRARPAGAALPAARAAAAAEPAQPSGRTPGRAPVPAPGSENRRRGT